METTLPKAPLDAAAKRTALCCVRVTGRSVATTKSGVRMATNMRRMRRVGCRTTVRISANETPPATPMQARAANLNRPLNRQNRTDDIKLMKRKTAGDRGALEVRFIINNDKKVAT